MRDKAPPEFEAYAIGMCCASVCTALGLKETAKRLNQEHPSGVGLWKKAETTFRTGATNPCPCHKYPTTHKHYLFEC